MSPWFRELLALPSPAFWEGLHARLRAAEVPLDLTLGDLKRAWRTHPIQPPTGWIIEHPQWVEDWLHYGPPGQDAFWRKVAGQHPEVFWGGPVDQIQAWAKSLPQELNGWGGATLLTWVELAQAHPHPDQVSPWLRGAWTDAALFEALEEVQDRESRILQAQARVQHWLAAGVRRGPNHPTLREGYPVEFLDALRAAERASDLQDRPAAPSRRPRRRA